MLDKNKRVIIVDFNHMAHMFSYSKVNLSVTKKINGQLVSLDTTIASASIKNMWRWSKGGRHPLVVCFDRPCPARKGYFMTSGSKEEYKGKREGMSSTMYDGVSTTQLILENAGVQCLYRHNYEADDLVFLAVNKAKEQYPDHYIDVITNDSDLVPLVDERVSVFLRSRVFTYAESKDLEKTKYMQITPRNYEDVVGNLSAMRKVYVPYNTALLYKVARGDTSDNIPNPFPAGSMTPTRLTGMVWQMKNGLLKEGYTPIVKAGRVVGLQHKPSKVKVYFDFEYGSDEGLEEVIQDCFVLNEMGEPILADVENLFRYTENVKVYYKDGREISVEDVRELATKSREVLGASASSKALLEHAGISVNYLDNHMVEKMRKTLVMYGFTEEESKIFVNQYRGMNLAQAYMDLPDDIKRPKSNIGDIYKYDGMSLLVKAQGFKINLPTSYL